MAEERQENKNASMSLLLVEQPNKAISKIVCKDSS